MALHLDPVYGNHRATAEEDCVLRKLRPMLRHFGSTSDLAVRFAPQVIAVHADVQRLGEIWSITLHRAPHAVRDLAPRLSRCLFFRRAVVAQAYTRAVSEKLHRPTGIGSALVALIKTHVADVPVEYVTCELLPGLQFLDVSDRQGVGSQSFNPLLKAQRSTLPACFGRPRGRRLLQNRLFFDTFRLGSQCSRLLESSRRHRQRRILLLVIGC
mmetsp:Transcript_11404/g.27410  ORF Transcript_11404/g.27410 Transcript_11404/m.27410 type:complete len:213 (+) Transcript_11404:97-735(+)